MIELTFKKFIRSRATIIGLGFILASGIVSIFIGKQFLDDQKQAIGETSRFQKEFIRDYTGYIPQDMGLLVYYLKFSLVNTTHPLAGISIGQRDINPSIQSVTIRNLENQKWDTNLNNPSNLIFGNMDLSFVIIYLFPLILIAFTYNLISEEKEEGTWKMILFQSGSPTRAVRVKMLISVSAVFLFAGFLLLGAKYILSIPMDTSFFGVILLFALYLIFWSALCYWVISWQRSSAFNAVALLVFWVGLTILSPAMVNSYITNAYPVPEALATIVKQRQGYHEKWDMDKGITMNKFYAHYPQFKKYPLSDKQFSWLWYYAMHQMGDDESARESASLKEKLIKREKASRVFALFLPVLQTQLALNDLARTDLKNHLLFLEETKKFHEGKRLFFYDKIFEDKPANSVNWDAINIGQFSAKQVVPLAGIMAPLLVTIVVLLAMAGINSRKPITDDLG
jgi:ABC-2 type transport system permease protein